MSTRTRHALGALAALAVLTGCQDDPTGPTALDDTLLPEVAAVAADAVVEDVNLMGQPFGFGPGAPAFVHGGPGGPGGPGGGQPGDPGGHHGQPGQPGGHHGLGGDLSGTRSLTFFDAAGVEQDAYDPITTATIHAQIEVSGEVERPGWSASVERVRDMTITGLEGEETTRTFNGTGEEAINRVRHAGDAPETTFDMVGAFTKTDVVVPVPGSDSRWPLSGTVHRTMTVTITGHPVHGDVTRTVDVTITFDGDATATAVIDGESFEVDLSARRGGDPIHSGFGRKHGG